MQSRMARAKVSSSNHAGLLRIASELSWHLIPPGIFFAWIFNYYPYRDVFALDLDEGINLMKALLVSRGFHLFSQIWSDQPPVFTYLLTGFFELFGYQVNAGRLLALFFSTLLIWASVQYLRLVWGRLAGLAGLVLLSLLPGYLTYSVSVLIGLPSLALAVLSMLFLVLWHQRGQTGWLWLSGLMFSLSIFTKMITVFVIPIFVVGLIVDAYYQRGKSSPIWDVVRPVIIWGTSFGLASLLLATWLVGPAGFPQLVLPHLQASRLEVFQSPDSTLTIQYHLLPAWPVLLLSLIGALILIFRKRWLGLYPLVWSALAYSVLTQYAPVWAHQQLLVSVPAALVAAGGLGEALAVLPDFIRQIRMRQVRSWWVAAALIAAVLILVVQVPQVKGQWQRLAAVAQKPTSAETTILRKLDKFAPQTNWLFTDQPMIAFRAGLLVPPELAVLSSKRVETGFLSPDEVQSAFQRYRPEQVLIGRFDFPGLSQALQAGYRLTYDRPEIQLYVRGDLN
jgi:4-amino-4-deoxy-L-arabinose transferase-like glycosyltransferase